MIKIIRKNQKAVMVFFAVVLMVMFLSNLGPQGSSQPSPVLRQVATLGGAKVTQLQLNNANEEWELLKHLQFADPNQPAAEPQLFVVRILGDELAGEIEHAQKSSQGSPLFFLLKAEAQRQGIAVSREELESIVTNNVSPSGEPGTEERERVEEAVNDCMMIQKLVNRAASAIKISEPYRQFMLANLFQNLTVDVETIRASSLLDTVAAPTDAEIYAQFDKYNDRVAAVADRMPSEFGQTDDPLGFGYKIPNRVTLQYIGISSRDVSNAAIASKSTEDWYVAAFGEFKANRADYDSRPVPSTQTSSTTQPASGVKTLDNVADDFTLHAPIVLHQLQQQETEALGRKILSEISEKLSSGYGTYRDAVASAPKGKDPTGPAAEFVTYKFMVDIASSIQAKYGVTPFLGNIQQFKSESQLADIGNISGAGIVEQNYEVTFPVYAIRLFQPWMSDADKNSPRGALAIAQWQPSNPISDPDHNIYVFRISGTDAAHQAAMSDVKDQVVADCKIAAAYAKALKAGRLLLSSANALGLDAAIARTKLPPALMTDPFSPEAIRSGRAPAVIKPLILESDSARQLAEVSQQLLITSPAHDKRPQLLAELYADRAVAVIELHEAAPSWDAESRPFFAALVTARLQEDQKIPLELTLFKPDAVAARLGYQVISK
jgi:hypothetical protein